LHVLNVVYLDQKGRSFGRRNIAQETGAVYGGIGNEAASKRTRTFGDGGDADLLFIEFKIVAFFGFAECFGIEEVYLNSAV